MTIMTMYKARPEPEEIDQDLFPPKLSVFIVSTGCLSLGTRYCVLVISKFMSWGLLKVWKRCWLCWKSKGPVLLAVRPGAAKSKRAWMVIWKMQRTQFFAPQQNKWLAKPNESESLRRLRSLSHPCMLCLNPCCLRWILADVRIRILWSLAELFIS